MRNIIPSNNGLGVNRLSFSWFLDNTLFMLNLSTFLVAGVYGKYNIYIFLVDHLKIVHVACIFVDFRIADDFPVEISPRCSVINRNLTWKQSELYQFIFSSNLIEYFIANNRILRYISRNSVTLFSLATTDIDLA